MRWRWQISGQVQGVGFRPFVVRAARAAGVTGRVLNDRHGVVVEVQGEEGELARFEEEFGRGMPPLARVERMEQREVAEAVGERDFVIEASEAAGVGSGKRDAAVAVDSAVCSDCLREMRDPEDRRFEHGLINCTNCGPRFSLVTGIPYDRGNTTMGVFGMCEACRREFEDMGDRRFHAQPVCCPECGPQVEMVKVIGGKVERMNGDPYCRAAEMLVEGKIVAIKGIGGFHLAVRADREEAVWRLRELKKRDAKPFALMVRDVEMARELVEMSAEGERELISTAAPIVLARRRAGARVARGVAAGTHLLGVMVAYTPVQHLVWDAIDDLMKCAAKGRSIREGCKTNMFSGAPATQDMAPRQDAAPRLFAPVMTSGNLAEEPLVIGNEEAVERLGGICDGILWHDRGIEQCVDDSVLLDLGEVGGEPAKHLDRGPYPGGHATQRTIVPIRRSRGYVPGGWRFLEGGLRGNGQTGICVGGELKNTVAVVRREEVIVSQHLGDLTHPLTYAHFRKAIEDLVKLFDVGVEFVAHDLHPGYVSTGAAKALARRHGAKLIGVQHHVAHAAGVLAEHGFASGMALVCDGTGFGTDGTIWGGELIEMEGARWKRVGRLRPMRLAGGDAAARDPRRSALALLAEVRGKEFGECAEARRLFEKDGEREMLAQMIEMGVNSPWTSSAGRLFDGVAALLGVCQTNKHEAEAAMALEMAAEEAGAREEMLKEEEELYEVRWEEGAGLWELDLRRLVGWLVEKRGEMGLGGAKVLARVFHEQLAEGLVGLVVAASGGRSMRKVPVGTSGGVFCNGLFVRAVAEGASKNGISTFFHNLYPTTDAGLAFGQAAFARHMLLTRAR